jgi:GNAT superfamily N-acetyltransferase
MIPEVSSAFDLRTAGVPDAEAMAETVRQGFESFRDWTPRGWDPPPAILGEARIREGLGWPSTWCLLAYDGDRLAGHVGFTQARGREDPRPDIPGLAHFWMLFVRRPWWGSGLATLLNGMAVQEAGLQGYEAIRLHTPRGNLRARAFYEREGWETDGVPIPEPLLALDLLEYRRSLP